MTEVGLFVYGSLSQGLVHFDRIRDFVEASQPAFIYASAHRLKVGYPVLTEQANDRVPGFYLMVKSDVSSDLLFTILDSFHGVNICDESKSLHFRRQTLVETEAGMKSAWCYFINPSKMPLGSQPIPGGDWMGSLQEKPALTANLTERQRTYVQRLGASVGREIVPIDLGLYRELMGLELIVDKGRRLALSKFGQEVYRYLG
jgi:gamma-glutamylcyclotransferase (GGCT)/AIG2-like uncharacterized protein YtfP